MNASPAGVNPYVGLRPFEREDSLYFFGRRKQTAELLERLHDNRFLAVLGRSGCGKSSLIRAGLIPALRGGFLVDDRDKWLIVVCKPGDAPLHNLAEALAAVGDGADTDALEKDIGEDQEAAVVRHLQALVGERTNVLLLVDQFEEIFGFRGSQDYEQLSRLSPTLRESRARRRAESDNFMDTLLALPNVSDLPVYVTLTMRSDFLGDCDDFYGLPEAMNRSRYLVPRLDRGQLREAVKGPALLSGVRIAPRLLDTVINDVGGRSDQLPVLQHALFRTWNAWHETGEGPLDLEHYEAIGGLRRALSMHAEEALREDDIDLAKVIFECLTDTDPHQRRIRRPTNLSELESVTGAPAEKIREVVERFREDGRNFLVVSGSRDGDSRIDISHESLIRQWKQLRDWIDEERSSRDQFLDLVARARGERALLRDPDLQLAINWRDSVRPGEAWARRYSENEDDFTLAMDYLQASIDAQQREEARQRRFRVLLRSAVATVVVALAGLTTWSLAQREAAVLAEQRAVSAESEAASLRDQALLYAELVDAQEVSAGDVMAEPDTGVLVAADPEPVVTGLPGQPASIALPKTVDWANRRIVYNDVKLNGGGNVLRIAPGEQFTISFQWAGSTTPVSEGSDYYCPGCIVQLYYGVGVGESGEAVDPPQCIASNTMGPGWSRNGDVKGILTAPLEAGSYFVTQARSLQYTCRPDLVTLPDSADHAIATVVVDPGVNKSNRRTIRLR